MDHFLWNCFKIGFLGYFTTFWSNLNGIKEKSTTTLVHRYQRCIDELQRSNMQFFFEGFSKLMEVERWISHPSKWTGRPESDGAHQRALTGFSRHLRRFFCTCSIDSLSQHGALRRRCLGFFWDSFGILDVDKLVKYCRVYC